MKRIFFFALASLALASCSQDEEFVAEKANGGSDRANGALSFSTYTAAGTRAADVTSSVIKGKVAAQLGGFQVSARYDGGVYFVDSCKFENGLFIDGTSKIEGAFDTKNNTYWWPRVNATDTIGFRAFNNLVKPAEWTSADCNQIKFTVQPTAATQEDLVVAYAVASSKPKAGANALADGVQPLNFTHALSKVNFSFVGTGDYTYTINKVELVAAGNADAVMDFAKTTEIATYNADGDAPVNTQAAAVKWTYTAIADGALVEAGAAKQGTLYTYYSADGVAAASMTDQNFMLLPQSGRIAVRVYYKVEDKNGKLMGNCGYYLTDSKGRHNDGAADSKYDNTDNKAIYGCKTAVITLGANDIPAWQAGHAYRFTMTLPKDNFIGDLDGDKVPDINDGTTADLDGDGETTPSASEFDDLTPIRFSVTVSAWENADPANSNITIK